jgi:uncharacterized membrane protein YcjF (UPF0283 family)
MSNQNKKPLLGDPLEYRPLEDESSQGQPDPHGEPEHEHVDHHQDGEHPDGQNHESHTIRKNDTGLGQPDFKPSSREKEKMRSLTPEEIESLRQQQEDLGAEFEKKLLELEKSGLRIPAGIYRAVMWALLLMGAVLGLFIVGQGVRFAAQVSSLSVPWNILATGLFLVFLGMILLVVFKVFKSFMLLKKKSKIDLKALDVLARRKRFQQLAMKKKEEARKVLAGYVQDYNLSPDGRNLPGLEKKDMEKLRIFKQSLTDKKEYLDSARWLKEFEESFVHVLDKAARARIRAYTKAVSVGTAASPVRFIDQMIVLYSSLRLVSELLEIYNLRPAFAQSTTVLSRAIIQAYLSGAIGEHSEAGVEAFSDFWEGIFGEISLATGFSAATDATRFILPKVSEGALNGFLIWRLGRQAQKMLRPV